MARFANQPSINPLTSTCGLPGEDTSNNQDFFVGVDVLTQYVQEHMAVANGSSSGLMSGSSFQKLEDLRTRDEDDAIFAQFEQIIIPLFIPNPEDGTIEVMENVTDNDVYIERVGFGIGSGSAIMTVTIDSIPVTGMTNLDVGTPGAEDATAANLLEPGAILGLMFSSSGGAPTNLRVTFRAKKQLIES